MPQWNRGPYRISTDPAELDLDVIFGFLSKSYWASDSSRSQVEASIRGSIPFGLFSPEGQVGFARVVTDRATFAWLSDVFVLDAHRGGGLGKFLVESVLAHPELQNLRRWLLGTADAHGLYAQFGFQPLPMPERFMQILRRAADR